MVNRTYVQKLFFCFCAFLWISDSSSAAKTGPEHDKIVVCYVSGWAVYRPEHGSFGLDNLDPHLCTHLVYAFAGLDPGNNTLKSLDPWQDLKENYGKGNYERMTTLKGRYPHLKVSLAVGGWNQESKNYSIMAADPKRRKYFVMSAVQFLKRYGFDGLDLDWEYPAKRGGAPDDKNNFVALVKDLKMEFSKHNYLLTSAIGVGKDTIDAAYDVRNLAKYLDFFHLMCYDYHGAWDGHVGAHAPLQGYNDDDTLSVEFSVKYMLSLGAPANKLVLGLPMYGRTFVLDASDAADAKTAQAARLKFGSTAAKKVGFAGPYTKEAGFMGYNEICMEFMNSSSGWLQHWDEQTSTPYATRKDQVISFDNQRSIALKVRAAIQHGLRGVMVWSIDTDDFRGDCGGAPDTDTYIDFYENVNALKNMPIYKEVLPNLNLPEEVDTIASFQKRNNAKTAYKIQNGDLVLTIPQRLQTNFALMRTIDEAITLAEQEKYIDREVESRMKQNEIPHGETVDDKSGVKNLSLCVGGFIVMILSLWVI